MTVTRLKWIIDRLRLSYLDTPLHRRLQILLDICRRSGRVDCNIRHFLHIWRPGWGWHTRQYQCKCVHLRYSLLDMNKSNYRVYWYNTRKRHTVGICTHCHRAYRNLCLHNHRYNGTDYSNKRRFYIHGLSYNDNLLQKKNEIKKIRESLTDIYNLIKNNNNIIKPFQLCEMSFLFFESRFQKNLLRSGRVFVLQF